jgi:hypothetical protein
MRTIIPVRVDDCNPAGLLRPLVYIDLAGLPLLEARAKFIGDIMAALEGKAQLHPARSQKSKRRKKSGFNQTAVGTNNLLVGRDYNHYEQPPQENIIIQPGPECISSEQKKIIRDWIVKLADGSVGTSRAQSFSHWWSFFQNTFKVPKYELLKSIDFNSAIDWCRNQAAMQVRSLKKTAPDVWRNSRMASIHSARERKGIEKQIYYSDIARRLKMKKSFTSLKDLTNRDLERVYNMVLKDARDV